MEVLLNSFPYYRRDLVDIHYFLPIVYRRKIVGVLLNLSHIYNKGEK